MTFFYVECNLISINVTEYFEIHRCIGKRIAEMEVSVLATRLLKQFRLEYNYGPIKSRNGLVLSPVSDLKFKLTEI